MSKGKKENNAEATGETKQKTLPLSEVALTREHVKAIQSLILSMKRIKMDQEALAEDIKALGAKMNVKPGEIKEMASWIMQEEEKGGVIDAKEKKLDIIRQVFEMIDEVSSQTSNASSVSKDA